MIAVAQGPRGIGGWLIVFLVARGLGIALSIVVIARISGLLSIPRYGPLWRGFVITESIVPALLALGHSYLIWRFVRRRNWRTVRIGVTLLWAMTVLPWCPEIIGAFASHRLPIMRGETFPFLLQFGTAAIWSTYLLRSKRVANTYLRYGPVDADELSTVFE
jgi:hypothetical protein